jgi:hypothetical protein
MDRIDRIRTENKSSPLILYLSCLSCLSLLDFAFHILQILLTIQPSAFASVIDQVLNHPLRLFGQFDEAHAEALIASMIDHLATQGEPAPRWKLHLEDEKLPDRHMRHRLYIATARTDVAGLGGILAEEARFERQGQALIGSWRIIDHRCDWLLITVK